MAYTVEASSFRVGFSFVYDVDGRKYNTFKEEISEYKHLSFKKYQNIVIPKVTQYINTVRCKQTIIRMAEANRFA